MSLWISDWFHPFKYAGRSFLPSLPPKSAPLTVPYATSTPSPEVLPQLFFRSPPDSHWLCFQKRFSICPLSPHVVPIQALVTALPEHSHSFPLLPSLLLISFFSRKQPEKFSEEALLSLKLPDISPSPSVKSKVFSRPVVSLAPFPPGPRHLL